MEQPCLWHILTQFSFSVFGEYGDSSRHVNSTAFGGSLPLFECIFRLPLCDPDLPLFVQSPSFQSLGVVHTFRLKLGHCLHHCRVMTGMQVIVKTCITQSMNCMTGQALVLVLPTCQRKRPLQINY